MPFAAIRRLGVKRCLPWKETCLPSTRLSPLSPPPGPLFLTSLLPSTPQPPLGVALARYSSSSSCRLTDLKKKVSCGPTLGDFIQQSIIPREKAMGPVVVTRSSAASAALPALEEEEEELEGVSMGGAANPVPSPALVDRYGRFHNYLRISITERCNLRCTYCMPAEGVSLTPNERLLQSEEIIRLARVFVSLGVDKIRLTGGEPLVRKDVVPLVRALRRLGLRELAITTNGVSPSSRLGELVDAGVTHFNISLDTLRPQRYSEITRRPAKSLHMVLASIEKLMACGLEGRLKVNNVIMRGVNDDELVDFVALTKDRALDVRFIEWMPFDSNGWNGNTFFPYQEMILRLVEHYPALARDVDGPNDTTKWYRVPGHKGRVGFISSMSQNFCGSCNRLRITADGKLKVCLFGSEELSLRDALRGGKTDEDMVGLISSALGKKEKALGGQGDMYSLAKSKNRPMILIGG